MTIPAEHDNLIMILECSTKKKYFPYEIGMILFQSYITEDKLFKDSIIFNKSFKSIPEMLNELYMLYQDQLIPIGKYIDGIDDTIIPVKYSYSDECQQFTSDTIYIIKNDNPVFFNVCFLIAKHIDSECIYPLTFNICCPETLFEGKSMTIDYTITI